MSGTKSKEHHQAANNKYNYKYNYQYNYKDK